MVSHCTIHRNTSLALDVIYSYQYPPLQSSSVFCVSVWLNTQNCFHIISSALCDKHTIDGSSNRPTCVQDHSKRPKPDWRQLLFTSIMTRFASINDSTRVQSQLLCKQITFELQMKIPFQWPFFFLLIQRWILNKYSASNPTDGHSCSKFVRRFVCLLLLRPIHLTQLYIHKISN